MSIKKGRHGAAWCLTDRDPTGTAVHRHFRTRAQAEAFVEDMNSAGRRGDWVDPAGGKLTIDEWAGLYLTTVVNLRPTTVRLYKVELAHIRAEFGRVRLSQMSPLAIQAWLAATAQSGVKASSVHRRYRVLRRMLQVAVKNELIARNPCDSVDPPTVDNEEMRFLAPEQVTTVAEAIGPWYRVFVYTAAETGMRWSELVGLKRGKVDLLRKTVTVTEQLIHLPADREAGAPSRWVTQQPKTKAGTRNISISSFLAEALEDHLASCSLAGSGGLVFPSQRGTPVGSSSWIKNHWKPAKAAAGVDPLLRFHDLRHTAVALAIAQGAHPKAIQTRLGHSTIQMTLDRYGHLFPELDGKIAEGLDGVWRAALASQQTAGQVVALGVR